MSMARRRTSRSSKSRRTAQQPASTEKKGGKPSREFPYRAVGAGVLKPAVPIALVGPNGNPTAPQLALVDSGCDYSTFPRAWAEPLGIDFDADCEPIVGNTASGEDRTQRAYVPGIHGLLMGHNIPLAAIFNPMLPVALLGREDFFGFFKVAFDQRRQRFRLDIY